MNMNKEFMWNSCEECPGESKGNCDELTFVVELRDGTKCLAYYDEGQFYNDLELSLEGEVKRWIELPE